MAYKKMTNEQRQQQVQELTARLEQGVRDVFDSENFANYIRVMSHFTKYSVNNTILIALQTGGTATKVAGYEAWQKNFGRQVNRGEKAIKIFAPMTHKRKKEQDVIDQATGQPVRNPDGSIKKEEVEVTIPSFRVASVFDISQTSGPPLPTLVEDLEGNVERYQDFVQAIRNISPVPVGFEEMEGKDGYYHQVEKRIAINDNLSEKQAMAAMIHELAHAKLHALDPEHLKESAKARGKDQRTMEVEAESVAAVVSSYFGIDTSANSWGYVASWSRNKELPELTASLQVIKDTAGEIIDGLEEEMEELRFLYMSKVDALEAIVLGQTVYASVSRGVFEEVSTEQVLAMLDDAWLNNGRTSGILMGNYLSLYFAEYLLSRIADDLQLSIDAESINCYFKYFSDDFYFFCNYSDIEKVLSMFDKVLSDYDFVRKNKKEIWTYETYNRYNLLTRLWKATIRAWNLEVLKNFEVHNKHPEGELVHKFSFLNQLVYRLDSLQDEKSKRSFIVNFFKTKHFQSSDYSKYKVNPYDLHQWFFLLKSAPESLLYVSHIINNIPDIKNDSKTKDFLKARYEEALKQELHDVQLYYYYAIKILGFEDVVSGAADLVLQSQNQVLISYYLKDGNFTESQKSTLKVIKGEEYWFQNYHLILYTPSLKSDLTNSVKDYLIPQRLSTYPNAIRENRYLNFYEANILRANAFIDEIPDVLQKIKDYLELRYEETAEDFT